MEDGTGQRDDQDITDVGSHVRQHTGKDHHQGDDVAGCLNQKCFHPGADKPAALRHTDAEHRHHHDPQRGKAGVAVDHLKQDTVQPVAREQVHHIHTLTRSGMDAGPSEPCPDP